MVDVKVVPKTPAINDPNEILVKQLSRRPFCIAHRRVLHLDIYPGRRLNISSVYFSVRSGVDNLATTFGKARLPRAMPWGFVLPPRIAVLKSFMRPVMHNARSAFCDGRSFAHLANAPPLTECLSSLTIHHCILQLRPPETSGLIMPVERVAGQR